MQPPTPFRVLLCEIATGIVCKPDGQWWRSDQNTKEEQFLRFATRQEAMDFIHLSRHTKPQLECHLYEEEQHRASFSR